MTSLLSRFERLEIFFGKIFVMLFMLCRGGFSQGDPILGEDGNPRVLQHIKECKNYHVAVHRYLHVYTNSHLYCEAVAAESKVKLCLMLGEEEWPLRGLLELILLRYSVSLVCWESQNSSSERWKTSLDPGKLNIKH